MDGPLDFDCYHLVEQILAYQSEQFYTNSINLCRNIKVGSFRNVFLVSSNLQKKNNEIFVRISVLNSKRGETKKYCKTVKIKSIN